MWLWLCAFLLIYLVYKTAVVPFFFWRKRGVPHNTPLPILGNFASVMLQKKSFYDMQKEIYDQFPDKRYCGFFQLSTPTLFIRDLELIKQVGVKQFDHFVDHRTIGSEHDVLFFNNLFSLKGDAWRNMRAFLSPAFTGSKMKGMCDLMAACAHRVTNYYMDLHEKQVDVELRDLFSRYANDVIATCAFGLECDSLKERDNKFYLAGKDATNFGGLRGFKLLLANFSPDLFRFLQLKIFPANVSDFFINLITFTIAYREKKKIVRPDIIHLLLEARKGKLKHDKEEDAVKDDGFAVVEESALGKKVVHLNAKLSDTDIASQCFLFFFAGFETASTLISFVATELALNPDTQEKLFAEIDNVMTESHGKPSYDTIMKMKYLDMVVSETLRKWPPGPALDRKCTKEFTIAPRSASEVPVTIKVGDLIAIPILGLQRDPQYFPNPDRFDPERFSDENKHNIVPGTYLPFGVGPRACIGTRFALLETKILIVNLLHKFEAVVTAKTMTPIVITTKSLRVAPDGGFWLGFKRRQTN